MHYINIKAVLKSDISKAIVILLFTIVIVFYKVILLGYTISPYNAGISGVSSTNYTSSGYKIPSFFIDPNIGFQTQSNGYLAQKEVSSMTLPLWNPYIGLGTPLLANYQSGAAFPLIYLFDFASSLGFSSYFMFLIFIAGLFTYIYLREIKLGFAPSIIGSMIFMYSGMFFWLYLPISAPIVFFPALMLYTQKLLSNNSKKNYILLSLFTFLELTSGFPEISFLIFGIIFIYYVYFSHNQLSFNFLKRLSKYLLFILIGFLLSSYLLLPFLVFLLHGKNINGGSKIFSLLSPYSFITQIMPYFYGKIFQGYLNFIPQIHFWANTGGYVGIGGFIFAIISLFLINKKNIKFLLFFYLIIIFTLLYMYGFSLFKPIHYLPLFSNLAFYRYSNFIIAFSLSVLTAYSLSNFQKIKDRQYILIIIVSILLLVFSLFLAEKTFIVSLVTNISLPALKTVVFSIGSFFIILFGIVLSLVFLKKNPRLTYIVIFCLIFIELFIYIQIGFSTLPKASNVKASEYIEYLQKHTNNSRVFTINGLLLPNYSGDFNIQNININDAIIINGYGSFIKEYLDPYVPAEPLFTGSNQISNTVPSVSQEIEKNLKYYSFIGVKYIVSSIPVNINGVSFIKKANDAYIYYNKNYFSRIFTVNSLIYKSNALSSLNSINLRKQAFIGDKNIIFTNKNVCASNPSITNYTYSKINIYDNSPCKSFVVLTNNYYSGWQLFVNGKKETIYKVDGFLQGFFLDKGKNNIELLYQPQSFIIGFYIFIATLLALVIYFFLKSE